ncbi:MAG TPA: L,D-transpeptidase [Aestuariivirgaceae bacterium]|jgi:lipoprotein-anchoring transpeptidase ErfK/SrfK
MRSVHRTSVVLALAALLLFPPSASANLVANIDLSRQVMTVTVGGSTYARWPVSTGRSGYGTPTGSYRPYLLRRMHYSSKYENSPMPHSVFFRGGYAIHGTQYVKRLGRRASHGCVRLHPSNARRLYHLVLRYGFDHTRIRIHW